MILLILYLLGNRIEEVEETIKQDIEKQDLTIEFQIKKKDG